MSVNGVWGNVEVVEGEAVVGGLGVTVYGLGSVSIVRRLAFHID